MIGKHHVEVKNRDAFFKFDINRNITIIRGDSGTGKTTLFNMISDYTRLKEASGVNISCDKECIALTDIDWANQLKEIKDSIVFIDEGAEYLRTRDFAKAIKNSDNYYVIFNRESLQELPYSVEEIYEIKSSGKYYKFKKMYKCSSEHLYYENSSGINHIKYDSMLTEDSKSGFQFYKEYYKDSEIECYSANSNAGIFNWLKKNSDRNVLVIADGAAFGPQIDRILKLSTISKFRLCLPESFEWLILKSDLIKRENINDVLENTSEYVDSSKYFSWENFFEKYLIESTVNTKFQYRKNTINPTYLNERYLSKIMSEIYKNQ